MMKNKHDTVADMVPKSWYRYCVDIIEVSESTSESAKKEKFRPMRYLGDVFPRRKVENYEDIKNDNKASDDNNDYGDNDNDEDEYSGDDDYDSDDRYHYSEEEDEDDYNEGTLDISERFFIQSTRSNFLNYFPYRRPRLEYLCTVVDETSVKNAELQDSKDVVHEKTKDYDEISNNGKRGNVEIEDLFEDNHENYVNMDIDTDEEYPAIYVTQTDTSVDVSLDSMTAVPEDVGIHRAKDIDGGKILPYRENVVERKYQSLKIEDSFVLRKDVLLVQQRVHGPGVQHRDGVWAQPVAYQGHQIWDPGIRLACDQQGFYVTRDDENCKKEKNDN